MPDEGQSLLALAEQRRQQPEAQLNRVRSAFTQEAMFVVNINLNTHVRLQAEESGQLPDLGSSACTSNINWRVRKWGEPK